MDEMSFASSRRFSQKKVESSSSDKLDHDDDTIFDDSFHAEPLEDVDGNIPLTNMPSFSSLRLSVTTKKPNKRSQNRFFENDVHDDDEGVINIKETTSSLSVETRQRYPPRRVRVNSSVLEQEEVGTHIEIIREWIESVHQASLLLNVPRSTGFNVIFDSLHSKRHIPMDVGVTYELENSLQYLTSYIEDTFYDDQADVTVVVESVAKIPNLIMTIVLIEDDADRERILNYQIVKWAIMNKHSCQVENRHKRSWLIDLIESGKRPLREKVIEYLELISSMTAKDLLPNEDSFADKNLTSYQSRAIFEHKAKFHEYREEVFSVFLLTSHFIPTLLLLSDDQLEDVAGISVIKYVVEWNLYRPIGVSVVFLDILSHIVIIISMRFIARMWSKSGDEWILVDVQESITHRLLFSFATLGVVYWFFRRVSEAISLITISRMTYLKHILSFWNLLDQSLLWATLFIYIITTMITVFGVNTQVSFPHLYSFLDRYWWAMLSITIGLLWLNLLGLIKVLNRQFATLILAISRIMRDTMLFLVVVVISILASGDMLHIYVSNDYEVCPENNPLTTNSTQAENTSVFCEGKVASYLAIYNMYMGDFDFGDFSGALLSSFVYMAMTFFGIVILLNVIIAIVCSSYEESNEQSEKLFGRARVSFVAAAIAFENLIKPNAARGYSWRTILLSLRGWAHIFVRFLTFTLALLVLFIISITYITIAHEVNKQEEGASVQSYIIAVVIMAPCFFVWLIFCSYLITGWEVYDGKHRILRTFQKNLFYRYFIFSPVMYVTRLLLGTSKFSTTNELYEGKKRDLLQPATSQNDDTNAGKIIAETEDRINTKFSMMEKRQKSNQDEISEIKHELREIKEMISRALKA